MCTQLFFQLCQMQDSKWNKTRVLAKLHILTYRIQQHKIKKWLYILVLIVKPNLLWKLISWSHHKRLWRISLKGVLYKFVFATTIVILSTVEQLLRLLKLTLPSFSLLMTNYMTLVESNYRDGDDKGIYINKLKANLVRQKLTTFASDYELNNWQYN